MKVGRFSSYKLLTPNNYRMFSTSKQSYNYPISQKRVQIHSTRHPLALRSLAFCLFLLLKTFTMAMRCININY